MTSVDRSLMDLCMRWSYGMRCRLLEWPDRELKNFAVKLGDFLKDNGLLIEYGHILEEILRHIKWREDPVAWAYDRFGIDPRLFEWSRFYDDHRWDGDVDPLATAMRAIASWEDVGVESATGTGKTYMAALMTLWILDNYTGSKVISVAPKEDQLKLHMWREIKQFIPLMRQWHPFLVSLGLEIRMWPGVLDDWFAVGFAVKVEAMEESARRAQGFHARYMLFIIEEAPGVHESIYAAIENTCTGPYNVRLAIGNPDSEEDPLHRFCLQDGVRHVRVSALDHPNVALNNPEIVPGAVSLESVEARKRKYGEGSAMYKSRVRGICPLAAEHALFNVQIIERLRDYYYDTGTLKGGLTLNLPREGCPRRVEFDGGAWHIWKEPVCNLTGRYIVSADVAGDEGGDKNDFHALVVFDRIERSVVSTLRMKGERLDYIDRILEVCEYYSFPYYPVEGERIYPILVWEVQDVGGLHLSDKFRAYPNLYRRVSMDAERKRERRLLGWKTTRATRPEIISELREWGNELLEHPERQPDPILWEEMKAFVWNERSRRYEAATGKHDDLVMALGIALVVDRLTPYVPYPNEKRKDDSDKKLPHMGKHIKRPVPRLVKSLPKIDIKQLKPTWR